MINIKITGIQEAINYFNDVARSIDYYATSGTREAGEYLASLAVTKSNKSIQQATGPNNTKLIRIGIGKKGGRGGWVSDTPENRARLKNQIERMEHRDIEVITDWGRKVTYVAPAPLPPNDTPFKESQKTRSNLAYAWRHFKCPYWKYATEKQLRGNISREDYKWESIVSQSIDKIKDIIVKRIREGIM